PSVNAKNANADGTALVVQPDGRIVVAAVVDLGGLGEHSLHSSRMGAVRFTASGQLDPTFGTGGKVETSTGKVWPDTIEVANDIVIQPDGKAVLAGFVASALPEETSGGFAAVRYTSHGTLDKTFGYLGR